MIHQEIAATRKLHLALKAEYFDAIQDGSKREEYRLDTPFWRKRLWNREYDEIVLTKGYPKAGDAERTMVLPWLGYVVKRITHPHFGPDPVTVFAIHVPPQAAK